MFSIFQNRHIACFYLHMRHNHPHTDHILRLRLHARACSYGRDRTQSERAEIAAGECVTS